MFNNISMKIEKTFIKDTLYIKLFGVIDNKELVILEKELLIIIDRIGIIKISIDVNNAEILCDINPLFRKIHIKLILKGGYLFLNNDRRILYKSIVVPNEYQVFKLSNFI